MPPRVSRAREADVGAVFVASIFWSSQRNRMLECSHRHDLMHLFDSTARMWYPFDKIDMHAGVSFSAVLYALAHNLRRVRVFRDGTLHWFEVDDGRGLGASAAPVEDVTA